MIRLNDFPLPLPSFKFSIPSGSMSDSMTVEEHLQQRCRDLGREIMRESEVLCERLQNQMAEGRAELLKAHNQACGVVEKQTDVRESGGKAKCNVSVVAKGGPHDGEKKLLKPRYKKACYVGRSGGKKFREKGLSYGKDFEVSTTHGKFEMMKDGKIYFTDSGSTNGTFLGETSIEEGDPILIPTDETLEIRIGATIMLCELVAD